MHGIATFRMPGPTLHNTPFVLVNLLIYENLEPDTPMLELRLSIIGTGEERSENIVPLYVLLNYNVESCTRW